MPTVPDIGSTTGVGESDQFVEEQKPSATQVLLAAATMHNQGRLVTGDSQIGYGGTAMPKFRTQVRNPKGTRK